MNTARARTVARRLAALPRPTPGPPAADADLLGRFLDAHDEDAFGVLVARHLPAVRAVCRSVLRCPADADDAAQATFLVLVRRAAAVRDRQALGGWLCRVAWRTANRLRSEVMRRSTRASGIDPDATPGRPAGAGPDVPAALHDEIGRLPEVYRVAVLTCYAAGVPTAEAAARLGWPKGTLLTRLAWARKRLRDRLTKRGVTLAGGFTAAFGGRCEVAGSAVLAARVAEVAVLLAAGDPAVKGVVSDRVRSLTEGMVRDMIVSKLKLTAAGLVAVAVLGLGLGRMTAGADPGDKKPTGPLIGAAVGQDRPKAAKSEKAEADAPPAVAEADPADAGEEVVRVRRPRGSYTREVAPFGRGTVTFAEKRLHVVAHVHVEKVSFSVTLDADYSINPDGMVYGIITGAEVSGGGEGGAEMGAMAGLVTDTPFAFRIRADEDAVSIRDIKFGPFGSLLFAEIAGGGGNAGKEAVMITGMIGGKFKADPHPDRNPPPAPARAKKK